MNSKLRKLGLLKLLFLLMMSNQALAKSRLYCSYKTKAVGGGCFFKDMQLYDQLKVSNVHCAPASAAMALSAITFGGVSYYTNSFVNKKFVYKSEVDRIKNFATYMGTGSGGSSWSGVKKYGNISNDIPKATKNVDISSSNTINDSHLRSLVRRGETNVLDYGHYTETCSSLGEAQICSYSRSGGHVVAVNGYFYTTKSSYTSNIFNPWNGKEEHRDISYLPNKTDFLWFDLRPYNNRTHYLRKSGSAIKIIDFVAGVNTN